MRNLETRLRKVLPTCLVVPVHYERLGMTFQGSHHDFTQGPSLLELSSLLAFCFALSNPILASIDRSCRDACMSLVQFTRGFFGPLSVLFPFPSLHDGRYKSALASLLRNKTPSISEPCILSPRAFSLVWGWVNGMLSLPSAWPGVLDCDKVKCAMGSVCCPTSKT